MKIRLVEMKSCTGTDKRAVGGETLRVAVALLKHLRRKYGYKRSKKGSPLKYFHLCAIKTPV